MHPVRFRIQNLYLRPASQWSVVTDVPCYHNNGSHPMIIIFLASMFTSSNKHITDTKLSLLAGSYNPFIHWTSSLNSAGLCAGLFLWHR